MGKLFAEHQKGRSVVDEVGASGAVHAVDFIVLDAI